MLQHRFGLEYDVDRPDTWVLVLHPVQSRLDVNWIEARKDWFVMSFWQVIRAIATDSHFLIPFAVFLVGIALLLFLR
jgi:hypothetical protein